MSQNHMSQSLLFQFEFTNNTFGKAKQDVRNAEMHRFHILTVFYTPDAS